MGNNRRYITMKKTILLAIVLVLSVTSFAQQQLATLNHNDSVTAFYGANALVAAHSAAQNGDIITLSSGVFNATDISKAVTIRGAGAWADTIGGSTMIRNNFNINVAQDNTYHLTMEGINAYNNTQCQNAYNAQFIKCNFQWISVPGSSNVSFVNCVLWYWNTSSSGNTAGTQFTNSVIMDCNNFAVPDTYINCVVKQHPSQASSRMFQNCVLYFDYSNENTPSNNSATSFNCLFVQMSADTNYTSVLYAPLAGHELWNMRGMNNVFKSFNGVGAGENFELLGSIADTYRGTDGTQIGIYGGPMPFDPRVTNPLIRRINVADRSNSDDKLPVIIEMGE